MNICGDLFLSFAKIGCFTFGGGYAMISLIEDLCVDRKQWISREELTDVLVVAESTPGPIAINCATYTGYRKAGGAGAVCATAGMILPSFLILYVISRFLDRFQAIPWVSGAFAGIRIAAGILVLNAGARMLGRMKRKPFPTAVMTAAAAVILAGNLLSVPVSSIMLILAAAAFGLGFSFLKDIKEKEGTEG